MYESIKVISGVEEAISSLFSEVEMSHDIESKLDMAKKAILAFKNETVDHINACCIDYLKTASEATELKSYDSCFEWVSHTDGDLSETSLKDTGVSKEALQDVDVPGEAQRTLFLKLGALVMFTRNVNLACGVANGTKGIVRRISRFRVDVEVATGPNRGEIFSCPRFNHKIRRRVFCFNRLQFPLKLAYALTVHKAQGMTLDKCVIDFRSHTTHHGCTYTALSRVRLPEHLAVILPLDTHGPANVLFERFLDVVRSPVL